MKTSSDVQAYDNVQVLGNPTSPGLAIENNDVLPLTCAVGQHYFSDTAGYVCIMPNVWKKTLTKDTYSTCTIDIPLESNVDKILKFMNENGTGLSGLLIVSLVFAVAFTLIRYGLKLEEKKIEQIKATPAPVPEEEEWRDYTLKFGEAAEKITACDVCLDETKNGMVLNFLGPRNKNGESNTIAYRMWSPNLIVTSDPKIRFNIPE